MSMTTPIPAEVARIVTDSVEKELRDIAQFTNREALDESGIYNLHQMAAHVYSLGYETGRRYQGALAEGERQRAREAAREEQS